MTGAIARIDDGVWTAIEHVNAIFDEDQQRLISVPAQAVPSGWAMRVVVMGVRATCWSQAGALDGVSARWVNRIAFMEDVLFVEWREGALLGTRPEDAFSFAATRPR